MSAEGGANEDPGKRPLENLYYLSEILAKIGLVFAGAFAVYQFLSYQESQRVDRVIGYVEQFEAGLVAEARRELRAKTRPYYDQFSEISGTGISPEDRRDITLLLIEEDADGSFADAIETVADFYEGLRLCTEENLCSRSVTEGYFCPNRASTFWDNYSPYILDRRSNNPSFGDALEWCASH